MYQTTKRPSGDHFFNHQYSTAVVNGGGPNIYDRLINDSTDNLLRPRALMIGGANRINRSFMATPAHWRLPSQAAITTRTPAMRIKTAVASKSNPRQFASANTRKERVKSNGATSIPDAFKYSSTVSATTMQPPTRGYSSHGYLATLTARRHR